MSVCKLRVLVIRLSPVLIAGLAAAFFFSKATAPKSGPKPELFKVIGLKAQSLFPELPIKAKLFAG